MHQFFEWIVQVYVDPEGVGVGCGGPSVFQTLSVKAASIYLSYRKITLQQSAEIYIYLKKCALLK